MHHTQRQRSRTAAQPCAWRTGLSRAYRKVLKVLQKEESKVIRQGADTDLPPFLEKWFLPPFTLARPHPHLHLPQTLQEDASVCFPTVSCLWFPSPCSTILSSISYFSSCEWDQRLCHKWTKREEFDVPTVLRTCSETASIPAVQKVPLCSAKLTTAVHQPRLSCLGSSPQWSCSSCPWVVSDIAHFLWWPCFT